MTLDELQSLLGWCALINYLVLLVWFLVYLFARDWVYRIHRRWFDLSYASFVTIHYSGMGLYKLLWFIFNLVPYLVLRFFI